MLNEQQQEQFTQLWTEAQPSVGRYVSSLVRDKWAARDVMQGVSLALLRKFNEYDQSRPFLPWALGVAKFEVLGHRRDAARNRVFLSVGPLDQYTEMWAEVSPRLDVEAIALDDCLLKLSDRQQSLVRLRYAEEMNSNEIAEHLSLTPANVRKILDRTRDVLRRCVESKLRPAGEAS